MSFPVAAGSHGFVSINYVTRTWTNWAVAAGFVAYITTKLAPMPVFMLSWPKVVIDLLRLLGRSSFFLAFMAQLLTGSIHTTLVIPADGVEKVRPVDLE